MSPARKKGHQNVKQPVLTISNSQEAIQEYYRLIHTNQTIRKYPEWDLTKSSPLAELIRAKRKLGQAEDKLEEKREDEKSRREKMNQQWKELRNDELSFRQSFIKFNQLIKENHEKRERAENRIKEERERQERRLEEVKDYEIKVSELSNVQEKMKRYVNNYEIYKKYLERVVSETNEFQSIPDIFNRYETLLEAKEVLSGNLDHSLAILEKASSNMHEITETKAKTLIGLSNELAQLQGRYDKAKALVIKWETIVARIKATAAAKNLELTQIRSCCWNIYLHICKRKGIPVEVDQNDIEQQLIHIKRTISEVKRIIRAAKRKAIKASRLD